MGAVAWGALVSAIVLAVVAVRLEVWRRTLARAAPAPVIDLPVIDLAGIERAQRAEDLAFDGIVGALLLSDPTFADSADRLARRDDAGPAA